MVMHWYCLPVPQRLEAGVLLISSSPVTSGLWRLPCFFSDAMSGVICQSPRFYTILDDAISGCGARATATRHESSISWKKWGNRAYLGKAVQSPDCVARELRLAS